MEPEQQREQHLKEHITKHLELQKKLEDKLRYEDDSKNKDKLIEQIKEVQKDRITYEEELNEIRIKRQENLAHEMPYITFDELDIVTKFIVGMQPASSEINFNITDISQKISKNNLTQNVLFLLTMGMGKVKDVGRFVEVNSTLRPDFPEKLKAGFINEYRRLRKLGMSGDNLFESLQKFSCGNSSDFKKEAAGLAVLSYLFEKCEVFER